MEAILDLESIFIILFISLKKDRPDSWNFAILHSLDRTIITLNFNYYSLKMDLFKKKLNLFLKRVIYSLITHHNDHT